MKIGLDFDNTIVRYDHLFAEEARVYDLPPAARNGTKKEIRDHLRCLPDGEISWQRLQGQVYGHRMADAEFMPGADDFLRACRARPDVSVVIVSHKTEFGHHQASHINLRTAARSWMAAQGLFDPDGIALAEADVHFLPTRDEKIARIADLRCDVFVDDLAEVLLDPAFPRQVRRILFTNGGPEQAPPPVEVARAWRDVEALVLA